MIGVVHMNSFKVEEAYSTTSFHVNAFFISRVVKEDAIHLVLHRFNFLGIHSQPILTNHVTQVFYLWNNKSTFKTFKEQLVIPKDFQGSINMIYMCFPCFVIYQDIIKEYKNKSV